MATGEDNGMPLIFRIRNNRPPFSSQGSFPHLLAVCWQYDLKANNGMPLPEPLRRMNQLEELLETGLEKAEEAFLSVIVTGNWYSRDSRKVMELVNKTLGELEPFPVQFSFQDDPEWHGYNSFRGIPGQSSENVAPPDADQGAC
jgi:Family of unknown function (DUF695)